MSAVIRWNEMRDEHLYLPQTARSLLRPSEGFLHIRLTWNRTEQRGAVEEHQQQQQQGSTTNTATGMSGEDVQIKQTCVIKLIPDARQLFFFFYLPWAFCVSFVMMS